MGGVGRGRGDESSGIYLHSVAGVGRLMPSSSRWSSVEIDYGLIPASSNTSDFSPLKYSKSYEFQLAITDKYLLKKFICISGILLLVAIAVILLVTVLHREHVQEGSSYDLAIALEHALLFFEAQKSGRLRDNPLKFRGDSGLSDGHWNNLNASLAGGFYDSGNNIKFTFTTAYTITLLSWSVMEYHHKYENLNQLDHIKSIIKWGTDYLLKLHVTANSASQQPILYSQVGSGKHNSSLEDDISCWQRPEDMSYNRPVSTCRISSATDLAGEIIAAMSAAALVLNHDHQNYSQQLIQVSEGLFHIISGKHDQKTYTSDTECGKNSRHFYNSTGYKDELVWGATWLFFATGNTSYLKYATNNFASAVKEELPLDYGAFYWNNKLPANAVLLTRLRYLHDPGFPYEGALSFCSDMASKLACSYISPVPATKVFNVTPGGLTLVKPDTSSWPPLQFSATAAFLSKLFADYLNSIQISFSSCDSQYFSTQDLHDFARSQISYTLGNNPMKLSYVVGFGKNYPKQVHHRAASIPRDGKYYNCKDGNKWRDLKNPNPNVLTGAMVAGPDIHDKFLDDRQRPEYTEPTISGNAGLVAALVALLDDPTPGGGIDTNGIFANIPIPLQ